MSKQSYDVKGYDEYKQVQSLAHCTPIYRVHLMKLIHKYHELHMKHIERIALLGIALWFWAISTWIIYDASPVAFIISVAFFNALVIFLGYEVNQAEKSKRYFKAYLDMLNKVL